MVGTRDIAAAFLGHRFDDALSHLAPDARWTLVGSGEITGAEDIAAACRSTLVELAGTTTRFTRFDVIGDGDMVAVDAEATYSGADGTSTSVASCDLYTFRDGVVVAVRSYTVEVGPAHGE